MSTEIREGLAAWENALVSRVAEALSSGRLANFPPGWPANQIPAIVCAQVAAATGEAAKVWLKTSGGNDSAGASLIVRGMSMDRLGNDIVDAIVEDTEEFARDEADPQARKGYELLSDIFRNRPSVLKGVVELSLEEAQKPWSVEELARRLAALR